MPLTALLVDDEPLAREGLRMLLSQDPDVSAIYEAKDGVEAVAAILNTRPDLVLVDDEPLAREGLRMLLSQDPDVSAIYEAKDGVEAVAAILNTRPDLVFLDVQMPEMDGFSVVREVGAERMPAVVF